MAEYRSGDAVRCVGIVATGYVGAGWAAFFLSRGLRVRVWGRRAAAEAELAREIDAMWPDLERLGLSAQANRHAINFDTDLPTVLRDCDFVQENAAERLDLKVDLYRAIDAIVPPDILIASSTSSLAVTDMQAGCRAPERCVLGHPFTPTHLMRLVEVVGGARTDPAAVDAAVATYAAWGKRPVRLQREMFGHIANRLASALFREAVNLVQQGIASAADVDTALVEGLGRKWAITGPFQSYHLSGGHGGIAKFIDTYGSGIQRRWNDLGQPMLDDSTRAELVEKITAAFADRSVADRESDRSRRLIEVQRLLGDA